MDDSNKLSAMDNLKSINTESAECEGFQMPSGNSKAPLGMFNEVAAVLKFQKLYRRHRTRRMLADSAVVAQELWWQAIYHAKLNQGTISFFENSKPENAASRWNHIRSHASKVGKCLCKDTEAEKLFFEHWIEAIDPRHRYGGFLYLYYKEWSKTDSGQPFFYWLDLGDGEKLDREERQRSKLQQLYIKYLAPQERERYEHIIVDRKITNKQTGNLLDTFKGSKQGNKWIFVISPLRDYTLVRGKFHHSSFFAGGATISAGVLIAKNGILKFISPLSGHYRPTEEKFLSFLSYFKDNGVNLDDVQVEDDAAEITRACDGGKYSESWRMTEVPMNLESPKLKIPCEEKDSVPKSLEVDQQNGTRTTLLKGMDSVNWSTGTGARIGCVADYPVEVRAQALEFVNLSSKTSPAS